MSETNEKLKKMSTEEQYNMRIGEFAIDSYDEQVRDEDYRIELKNIKNFDAILDGITEKVWEKGYGERESTVKKYFVFPGTHVPEGYNINGDRNWIGGEEEGYQFGSIILRKLYDASADNPNLSSENHEYPSMEILLNKDIKHGDMKTIATRLSELSLFPKADEDNRERLISKKLGTAFYSLNNGMHLSHWDFEDMIEDVYGNSQLTHTEEGLIALLQEVIQSARATGE